MDLQFVFIQYFTLLAFAAAAYISGHLLLHVCGLAPRKDAALWNFVAGIMLLTTAYATVHAHGRSILASNLLLFAMAVVFKRQGRTEASSSPTPFLRTLWPTGKEAIWSLLALSFIFLLNLSVLFDLRNGAARLLNKDYSFYTRLAASLRDHGVENTLVEAYLPFKGSLGPYHYFEVWLAAGISHLTGFHDQFALALQANSLLFFGSFLGAMALLRELDVHMVIRSSVTKMLLALSLLFITVAKWLYPVWIPLLSMDVWGASMFAMPKNAIVYVLLFPMVIALLRGQWMTLSLLACTVATAYTPVAPVVFLTVGTLLLWAAWQKLTTLAHVLRCFIPMVVLTIAIAALYIFLGDQGQMGFSTSDPISHSPTPLAIKTMVNIAGKGTLQILITTFPFLLLGYWALRRVEIFWRILLLFILTACFGLLVYAVMHGMHDSVQLWTIIYLPVANIFIWSILTLTLLHYKFGRPQHAVALLFLLVLMYMNIPAFHAYKSPTGMEYQPITVVPGTSPRFAFITDKDDYTTVFTKLEDVYIGSTHSLMRQFDPLYITCISNQIIPSDNEFQENRQKSSTFLRYVEELKAKGEFSSYEQAQIQFVQQFKVDYLLVSRQRPLPSYLQELFDPHTSQSVDGYAVYVRHLPTMVPSAAQ